MGLPRQSEDFGQTLGFYGVPGGAYLVLPVFGAGKSTLLRTLYGNYLPAGGSIRVRHAGEWLELVGAEPRDILQVRQQTLGYVSQFLRVIPRVACLDVVMEPALARGWSKANAQSRAEHLLTRLNIPQRLGQLAAAFGNVDDLAVAQHHRTEEHAISRYNPGITEDLFGGAARRQDRRPRRRPQPVVPGPGPGRRFPLAWPGGAAHRQPGKAHDPAPRRGLAGAFRLGDGVEHRRQFLHAVALGVHVANGHRVEHCGDARCDDLRIMAQHG